VKFTQRIGICILALMVLSFSEVYSQTRTVSSAQKRKEQVESGQKKRYSKARNKEINRRYNMQTDATKQQMKDARRRAKDHNSKTISKKDPILDRLFKRHKKGKK